MRARPVTPQQVEAQELGFARKTLALQATFLNALYRKD